MAEPVRLIKRYANRKLYDTGSGELTSLRRIEELVRAGVDIRVVDHDTGEDMTSEVLVGILGNSMGAGTIEGDAVRIRSAFGEEHGDAITFVFTGKVTTAQMAGTLDMGEYLSARWTATRRGRA